MRAKRRTEQEQYEIIMECKQSGLSDHQWCLEHDINPGTFYNWVRRFRKQACEFPAPAGKDRFQAIHQEVVKMEIIPDQSTDLYEQSSMELQIGQAVLRISNQTDSRLLEQTLKLIGAFSFCGKSKKDDPAVFWLWDF